MKSALLALLLLVPSAPSQPDKEGAPAPPPTTATVVKLVDAGAADGRRPIRYKLSVGDKQTVLLRMAATVKQELDGEVEPADMPPPLEMRVTSTVDKIEGDALHLGVTLADLTFSGDVDPAHAAAFKKVAKAMEQVKGEIVANDLGRTRSVDFKAMGDNLMAEQLAEKLEESAWQWLIPLPEEPIAAGAKWQITEKDESDGMTMEMVVDYSLAELTAVGGKVLMTLTTTMPAQDLKEEGLPEGAKMRLESGKGKGKGECVVAWDRLMPSTMKLKFDLTMNMTTTMGEEVVRVKHVMEADCDIKPAPEKTTNEKKDAP